MSKLKSSLFATIVIAFACGTPATAQCAGSYQKEPMFPDIVTIGPVGHLSSPSPSQFLACGSRRASVGGLIARSGSDHQDF